ncbi:hypothetical protein H4R34_002764 [Dimargaris verticillata]|uniref:Arrestin C-terminal-like domain-containing protein n=1 Tax=Dimargaris verticillata TaxID=2761393 RepID=A0A9W8B189_9FUNG|nr:hypothetical protein H4R34_002764 [Dimargaris verticillata]
MDAHKTRATDWSQWLQDRLFKPDFRRSVPPEPHHHCLSSLLSVTSSDTLDHRLGSSTSFCASSSFSSSTTPAPSACHRHTTAPRFSSTCRRCMLAPSLHHRVCMAPATRSTQCACNITSLSTPISPVTSPPISRPASYIALSSPLSPAPSGRSTPRSESSSSSLHPSLLSLAVDPHAAATIHDRGDLLLARLQQQQQRQQDPPAYLDARRSPSISRSASTTPTVTTPTFSPLTSPRSSLYHLPLMKPSNSVNIVLFENPLVFRGSADEAAGCLLQGQVILKLYESMKIKAITLHFRGEEHVFWADGFSSSKDTTSGQRVVREKAELIDHQWHFAEPVSPSTTAASSRRSSIASVSSANGSNGHLTPTTPSSSPPSSSPTGPRRKSAVVFAAGQYAYDFSLAIPGNLPETAHTEHGQVSYKIKAVVERTKFHLNMTEELIVPIKRQPLLSSTQWLQSLDISDTWDRFVTYEITAPSRVYSDGTTIPLSVRFTPQTKGLKVISVTALLKEYTKYTVPHPVPNTAPIVRKVAHVVCRLDKFPSFQTAVPSVLTSEGLDVPMPLRIPKAYKEVQYDAKTRFMEVQHKLKLLVKLQDATRRMHSIFIAAPVAILYGNFDDLSTLPPYVACDPENTLLTAEESQLAFSSDDEQAAPYSSLTRSVAPIASAFGQQPTPMSLATTASSIMRGDCTRSNAGMVSTSLPSMAFSPPPAYHTIDFFAS